jgi:hypothetical protein
LANKVHKGNKCARNLSCHSEQEFVPTRVLKNIRAKEKFFLIKKTRCCAGIKSRTQHLPPVIRKVIWSHDTHLLYLSPPKKNVQRPLVKQLPVLSRKSQALCAFWNNILILFYFQELLLLL